MPGTVKGLFYGDPRQFLAQVIGTAACIVWVAVTFYIFFKVCDAILGNRVSAETELAGLDIPRWACSATPTSPSTRKR